MGERGAALGCLDGFGCLQMSRGLGRMAACTSLPGEREQRISISP